MKYLGVIPAKRLTFTDHVQYIKRKCIGRIKIAAKLIQILDLYKTLVTFLLDYCDIVYDTLSGKDNQEL